jgi:hypothetical protein
LTGLPILIGEFHIGVPADGLAAGLAQAKDRVERGIAYRYCVERAASLEWFLGAHNRQPVVYCCVAGKAI